MIKSMTISLGADVCPKSMEFHAGLQSAGLFPCVFFAHCEHAKY